MTSEQVAQLSPEQLKAKLTHLAPDQIGSITGAQLASFSAQEISAFPIDLRRAITGPQMEAMGPEKFQALLNASYSHEFSPEQCSTMSPNLMRQIPLADVNDFVRSNISHLEPGQLRSLTAEQVGQLQHFAKDAWELRSRTIAEIQAIRGTSSSAFAMKLALIRNVGVLTPAQFAAIPPESFRHLPPNGMTNNQLQVLTPAQLGEMDQTRLRENMSSSQQAILRGRGLLQ